MKLDAEKKKFAAARKFKDAQNCQTQLKQFSVEAENYEKFLKGYLESRQE